MSFILPHLDFPRRIFREVFPFLNQQLPTIIPEQSSSLDGKLEINVNLRDTNPNEYHVEIIEDDIVLVVLKREFEINHSDNVDDTDTSRKTRVSTIGEFAMPKGVYDLKKFEAKVSTDGILTLTAPKIRKDVKKVREIPIKTTGEVFKAKL